MCPSIRMVPLSMHNKKALCSGLPPGPKRRFRADDGNLLVEMVVGVLVSSIFAGAIVQSMAQGMSVTSGAQNQVLVASMAQEVTDAARNLPFSTLAGYAGTYPLTVQLSAGGSITCPPYPRPLLLDQNSFSYGASQYGSGAVSNTLNGNTCNATETIVNNMDNTVTVTVTINWRDSTGPHTYSSSTRIAQNGIGA